MQSIEVTTSANFEKGQVKERGKGWEIRNWASEQSMDDYEQVGYRIYQRLLLMRLSKAAPSICRTTMFMKLGSAEST
jgi:hypothetical protein